MTHCVWAIVVGVLAVMNLILVASAWQGEARAEAVVRLLLSLGLFYMASELAR